MADATSTTSNTRITVAFVNERVTALAGDIAILTSVVTRLAESLASAQLATPAPVAEVVAITSAPSTKARKATPRKAASKATASKVSLQAKVTEASGVTVSLEEAAALVATGEDKWKILVTSSTTGKPIPYGTVERALKAQARAAGKATATKAPAKRVSKASKAAAKLAAPAEPDAATRKALTSATGKALADAAAQGDANAAWEIARRAAKRATK